MTLDILLELAQVIMMVTCLLLLQDIIILAPRLSTILHLVINIIIRSYLAAVINQGTDHFI